jgi:poly(A) polymerase
MKVTATNIVKKLVHHGFRAYFAGGCVRDLLMKKKPHDYDIATNAKPEQIEKLFKKTIPIGKQFGVMIVIEKGHHFEIATFRSDSGYSDGRRPDAVLFTDPREDAKRRDFTINGMFYNPIQKKVLDYVNGKRDLTERLIHFIGSPRKRIEEDHLRIIRAIRFAHQINGQYHPETYKAIKHHAHLITDVSKERIRDELNKILLLPNRSKALEDMAELGVLEHIFPELLETKGIAQPFMYHQEGSVWHHIMRSLASIKYKPSLTLIWAILLHDIGKPRTFHIDNRIRFNRHDHVSSEMAKTILKRFALPKKFIERVSWIVAHHMMLGNIPTMDELKQIKWVINPNFRMLMALLKADINGTVPKDMSLYKQLRRLEKEIRHRLPRKIPQLLSGKILIKKFHMKPGPAIGELLEEVRDFQLTGEMSTKQQAMDYVDRKLKKQYSLFDI